MKKVKILTIILAIILISAIAFLGVYSQVQNRMENKVKSYDYAMDLKGVREVRLKVSSENKTIIKDKDGKEVEDSEDLTDEQITQNGYTKEETPYNPEETLTRENYEKSKEVIEKRLKELKVEDYDIKLNEQTGDIILELPEKDNTDVIVSNIYTKGDFKIIDSDTKEVLMDNNDIKKAAVMYGSNSSSTQNSGTSIYLDIEFNKDGKSKLEDISNKYVKSTNTENNTTTENTTTEESTDNTQDENTTTENAQEQTTEKKITMMVDDSKIMSTSFDQTIKTGKLQLSIGQASTDTKTLNDYAEQASNMATVLDSGKMPIKYDLDKSQYVLSDVDNQQLDLAKYIALGIVAIGMIIFVLRYKTNGLLGSFSLIGLLSTMVILVRYANVELSFEGLFAIGLILILEYIFINKILYKMKKENEKTLNKEKINKIMKETYSKFFVSIIPICIAVITFCFMRWIPLSSFGMVMFWGITLIAIYNLIITGSLLKIKADKK